MNSGRYMLLLALVIGLSGCSPRPRGWGRVDILSSQLGPSTWTVHVADQGQGVELFVDGSPRRGVCRRTGRGVRCWVTGLRRGFHRLAVTVSGRGTSRRTGLTSKRGLADEVIYEVLLDRFADGDTANNLRVDPRDPKAAHGGDLRGLRKRLGTLKRLGVTALLLSPIWEPGRAQPGAGQLPAYVGARPVTPLGLSRALGSPQELMRLLAAARRRGLRVLLDLPRGRLSLDRYLGVVRKWLIRTFADGVRMGPHRPGEEAAWAAATRRLARLVEPLIVIHHGSGDAARLKKLLGGAPAGSRLMERDGVGRKLLSWLGCPGAGKAVGFNGPVLASPGGVRVLSGHRHPVLGRRCPGAGRAALALTLHLLLAEIPKVYYADAILDPPGLLHPDIDWSVAVADSRFRLIRKLLGLRRGVTALRHGGQQVARQGEVLVVRRVHRRCRVLVLANRAAKPQSVELDLGRLGWPRSDVLELVDRLDGRGYTARGNRLKLAMGASSVKVLVPAAIGACSG